METTATSTIERVAGFPIELRQLLTEDRRFVDIPVDLLRYPTPKPAEFLYFQRYYEDVSPLCADVRRCATAEEKVDLLAAELDSMHALMSGYVKCLVSVSQHFDKAYTDLRKEQMDLKNDFFFNRGLVMNETQLVQSLQRAYFLLEEKVALKVQNCNGLPKLPIVKEIKPRRNHPLLTEEEEAISAKRASEHSKVKANASTIAFAATRRREKEMVDELAHPELRHSDEKGKDVDRPVRKVPDEPLDPRVTVKIEKLAESLDKMGETFARAQMKTERELEYMRFQNAEVATNASEFWDAFNYVQLIAYSTGAKIKQLQRVQRAYENWADRPVPETEACGSSTTESSLGATTPDPSATPTDDVSQPPNNIPVPLGSNPLTAPALPSGAYAVCITMEHPKPLEELTREEAISALSSLPQHLTFVPLEALHDLQVQKTFDKISRDQEEVHKTIDALGARLPRDFRIPDVVLNGQVSVPMVRKKRTEVYDDAGRVFEPDAGGSEPNGPATVTENDAKGKGISLKRSRELDPVAEVPPIGTSEDTPVEKPTTKRPKRARKA